MTKDKLLKYCEKRGYKLSEDADEILKQINSRNGLCPCKYMNGTRCPCPEHRKEIADNGKCHCGLFLK